MNNSIVITIPGKPIAKKRPRFARHGKFVMTYNDQETEEGKWLLLAKSQLPEDCPVEGPLRVQFKFCMPIPKSTSLKKRDKMLYGNIRHTKKPDCSNLIKFVEDCLNGFAWKDDSQIVGGAFTKIYSDNPQTIIKITRL